MSFSHSPKIVTDGLVFAVDAADKNSYPGSGTTWYDLSGNGNDGTLTNGPTFDSGNGGSIVFDGTNDYVDTGYTGLTVHTNATTSFWCKMGDFSGAQTMGCHNSKRFYVGFNGVNAFMGVADSYKNTTDISSYIAIDTWMHICMVAEDGTATYYIDGVARDTDTYTQSSGTNPNTNFFIGATSPWANYYNGSIKNCAIWNRALTATEVSQNFNAHRSMFGA